jgi:hypothetical protein
MYCPQVDNAKYHGSAPANVSSSGIVRRTNIFRVESHHFVAYRSGRSVDIAAAAAAVSMTCPPPHAAISNIFSKCGTLCRTVSVSPHASAYGMDVSQIDFSVAPIHLDDGTVL